MQVDLGLLSSDPTTTGARARALEERGVDGAFSFDGSHDPFLGLVTAAGTTDRLLLYPAVAIALARNPMLVAQVANDLQRLTDGRFALGLGPQIRAHVTRRFSMPWDAPLSQMREFVGALRAIWASWHDGAPLDFRGEHYQHTLMTPFFVPPTPAAGPPPIWLAAVGPRMLQLTGEIADGLIVHPFHTAAHLDDHVLARLHDGVAAADRDPAEVTVVAMTMVALGHDDASVAAARDDAKHQIGFYASTPAYRGVLDRHGFGDLQERAAAVIREGAWGDLAALVPDELVDLVAVVGTPDQVADQLVTRNARADRTALVPYDHAGPDGLDHLVTRLSDA